VNLGGEPRGHAAGKQMLRIIAGEFKAAALKLPPAAPFDRREIGQEPGSASCSSRSPMRTCWICSAVQVRSAFEALSRGAVFVDFVELIVLHSRRSRRIRALKVEIV